MARKRDPYMTIPIVLTIGVLIIAPTAIHQQGFVKGLFLVCMAIGFPWLLYFIISRAVERVVSTELKKQKENENQDFV